MSERLIGTYMTEWSDKPIKVYVQAHIENGSLSVAGWAYAGRSCVSGGQCIDEVRKVTDPAKGLSRADLARLVEIWDRWHLNDMRAGCEHQRRWGWDTMHLLEHRVSDRSPYSGLRQENARSRAFRRISRPCPACGYSYGSAWLREELPQDVIDFVEWFNKEV